MQQVFFSCLQADDTLFLFVVVQQIQNFEVKTETTSQSYQHLTEASMDIFSTFSCALMLLKGDLHIIFYSGFQLLNFLWTLILRNMLQEVDLPLQISVPHNTVCFNMFLTEVLLLLMQRFSLHNYWVYIFAKEKWKT